MLRGRAAAVRPPALPGLRHALAQRGAAAPRPLHRSTGSGWHLTAQAGTRTRGQATATERRGHRICFGATDGRLQECRRPGLRAGERGPRARAARRASG